MDEVSLPAGEVSEVDVDLRPDELEETRRRAGRDELAPKHEETLLRYLVYLGVGYVEADRVIGHASGAAQAFDRLHRLFGAVGGRAAVLRFHYSEQGRMFVEEKRAQAAHERMAGAYGGLVDKMKGEIEVREERVRNLEAALTR